MEKIIYIIGQGLGVVAIILGFLSYQVRSQKKLLLLQTATGVVFCLHFLMIGATSGMALNVISVIRNTVYYFRNKKGSNSPAAPVLFAALMAVVGIFTWEAWYTVFTFAGMIISTLAMALPDSQKVRKSILITSPLVLLYDLFAHSYGGMVYETVAIISSAVGIRRHRKS